MFGHISGDDSRAVITAQGHIASGHGTQCPRLPKTCVLYFFSRAIPALTERLKTRTLTGHLPCFLINSPCYGLEAREDICFAHGGWGAPCAADMVETLFALGVRRIVLSGLCGVFVPGLRVGDGILPEKILSEEGASRHYWEDAQWAAPDAGLYSKARSFFSARGGIALQNTVTTDAVYRQTFKKEAYWREMGCAGVDMEGSAVLNVARYLGMEAVALFMASDAHPLTPDAPKWDWSLTREQREAFAFQCMEFAMSL